jgi:hypothetical protein
MNVDDELGEFLLDFDFDNWLLDLADADRMKELIEPLPDDWKITDYPAKDKGKDKEESSGSTRTRREPDEPDDEPEEEAGEERKNRFQDLQRKAKERAAAKA